MNNGFGKRSAEQLAERDALAIAATLSGAVSRAEDIELARLLAQRTETARARLTCLNRAARHHADVARLGAARRRDLLWPAALPVLVLATAAPNSPNTLSALPADGVAA